MESLHSYCKRYDIPKSTAYKHLKDLGISVTHGLSQDGIAALQRRWPSQPQAAITPDVLEPQTATSDPLALYEESQTLTFGHYQAPDRRQSTLSAMEQAMGLAGDSANQQTNFIDALMAANEQLGEQAGMLAGLKFAQGYERSQQAVLDHLAAKKGLGKHQTEGEPPSS